MFFRENRDKFVSLITLILFLVGFGVSSLGFNIFDSGMIVEAAENSFEIASGSANKVTVDAVDGSALISLRFRATGKAYARLLQAWDSAGETRCALIYLDGKRLLLSYRQGGDVVLTDGGVALNTWYELSVHLDFDNHRIIQVYLDGKALLTETKALYDGDSVSNLGSIEFKNESDNGSLYIEDLTVEKILYPEIYEKLSEANELLSASKEGTTAGTYPHSAFTMLRDCCTSAQKASAAEGLSETEKKRICTEIAAAVKVFESSKIEGRQQEPQVTDYGSEDFEGFAENTSVSGFVANKNVKAVGSTNSNRTGISAYFGADSGDRRLTANLPKKLSSGKYVYQLSFMHVSGKGIPYLIDLSDGNGNYHGIWLGADASDTNNAFIYLEKGSDTSASDNQSIGFSYSLGVWYDLKVEFDIGKASYSVYAKKSADTNYTSYGTYSFNQTTSEIGRWNIRDNANSSVFYIDDIKLTNYVEASETIVNRANSVSISGADEMYAGTNATLTATVYDRYHETRQNEEITWSVVSGNVSIDENGVLSVDESCVGMIRVKAETESGLYECADILCLPTSGIVNLSAMQSGNKVCITGNYEVLKYKDVSLTATISGADVNKTSSFDGSKTDGSFSTEVELDATVKCGNLQVTVSDDSANVSDTVTIYYYGSDTETLFLEKAAQGTELQKAIDWALTGGLELGLNFVYREHEKEYCEFIENHYIFDANTFTRDTFDAMVEETNLLLGVRYASSETIEGVMNAGNKLLSANGFDEVTDKLTDEQIPQLYVELIGAEADSVTDLCNMADAIADEILKPGKDTNSKKDLPSYRGNKGGGGGTGTKVNITPVVPEQTEEASQTDGFKDMNEALWAEKEIKALAEAGVLQGYDGYVRPNNGVTRAEFAKLIVTAFDLKSDGNKIFSDVAQDAWYYESVGILGSYDLITGYPDGSFRPNATISRQEAAVILNRCINSLKISVYTKNEAKMFSDAEHIADYAEESISVLSRCGIISGRDDGAFEPNVPVTRAEAAVMLYQLLEFTR